MVYKSKSRPRKGKKKPVRQKQKQMQNVRQIVTINKPVRRQYVRRRAPVPSAITNISLNTDGFINQNPNLYNTLEALVKQHNSRFVQQSPNLLDRLEEMIRQSNTTVPSPAEPKLEPGLASVSRSKGPMFG